MAKLKLGEQQIFGGIAEMVVGGFPSSSREDLLPGQFLNTRNSSWRMIQLRPSARPPAVGGIQQFGMLKVMTLLAITLVPMALNGCHLRVGADHSTATMAQTSSVTPITQEERHRLYSAALAASDSPLDTTLFKDVCQKIGIFDEDGNPNGRYMTFVQEHVQWGMKPETNQFRSEINTKERAQEYVLKHLP